MSEVPLYGVTKARVQKETDPVQLFVGVQGLMLRCYGATLEATQGQILSQSPTDATRIGQILSQSPTDATRFWWHLYGS